MPSIRPAGLNPVYRLTSGVTTEPRAEHLNAKRAFVICRTPHRLKLTDHIDDLPWTLGHAAAALCAGMIFDISRGMKTDALPSAFNPAPISFCNTTQQPTPKPAPVVTRHALPVALVTGASTGLGRATAQKLLQQGYLVFAASRNVAAWLDHGPPPKNLVPLVMDVTDEGSIDHALQCLMERAGRLDVLVNNAGIGVSGPFEETPIEAGRAQMETNFFGAVRVCQKVLPLMRAQHGGCVVNISSIGGRLGLPFQSYYSASKFALEGWSESLRYEMEPFNIRVALVEPGNFSTAFYANRQLFGGAECSPYKNACERALAVMVKDEMQGGDPSQVANAVARIVQQRRPPIRVAVGPWFETWGLFLSSFLPRRLFDLAYRKVLGVA